MLETVEDRTVPTPVVNIAALSDANEGGMMAQVSARLTRTETSGWLVVNLSTSGTATEGGTDYYTQSTASFADGQATTDVHFLLNNDSTSEPTETVIVSVASGTGYTIGSPASATMNIFDNDAQYVSVAVEDAGEYGDTGAVGFTRTGDLSGTLTVNFSLSGSTATSGTDYTSIGTTVTFTAGSALAIKTITPIADNLVEGDETVYATVTSGTGYTVGSPSYGIVYIHDNTAPVATDDTPSGNEDTNITGNVLSNDTDADGNTLSASVVDEPWFGELTLNSNGSFTYTPNDNFFGTDTFTYQVSDGYYGTDTGTVTITVNAVGENPVVDNQAFEIEEHMPDDTIVGFVQASTPDYGRTLTYSITAGNTNSTFAIDADTGAISVADTAYLDHGTTASYTLTVQVADNAGTPLTDTATISITVIAEADPGDSEIERIGYLNDGYGYIRNVFDGGTLVIDHGLDPTDTDGPTGQILSDLYELTTTAQAMLIAVGADNSALYESYRDYYDAAVLTFMSDLPQVEQLSVYAIESASALAKYSEGDAFRLEGIDALMRELNGYLDQIQSALDAAGTANANLMTALAGHSLSDPLLETTDLNLSLAMERLSALQVWSGSYPTQATDVGDPGNDTGQTPTTVYEFNIIAATLTVALADLDPNQAYDLSTALGLAQDMFDYGEVMLATCNGDATTVTNFFDPAHDDYNTALGSLTGAVDPVGSTYPDGSYTNYGVVGGIFSATKIVGAQVTAAQDAVDAIAAGAPTGLGIEDKLRYTGIDSFAAKTQERMTLLLRAIAGAFGGGTPLQQTGLRDQMNTLVTETALMNLIPEGANILGTYDFVLNGDDSANDDEDTGDYSGIRDYLFAIQATRTTLATHL